QTPALLLAEGARLHDPDGVSNTGGVVLVMGHELGRTVDELPIDRMLYLAVNRNGDRLLHLIADDLADPFFSKVSFRFHPLSLLGFLDRKFRFQSGDQPS